MLLFPFPFGARLAGVPTNLPQVLADCIGDLIVRDTAHVATTGVCFHARTISYDVFSGQANSQVDNTSSREGKAINKKSTCLASFI